MVKDVRSSSSSLSDCAENLMQENRVSGKLSRILAKRPSCRVSGWTCTNLCAVFFVAGVLVGCTFKRRLQSWASKLLKLIKDD